MATLDTLQDAVNTLTSSTTELLDEVQVNKSTLTDSATSASNSATNAASSASSASSSASSASSSASAAASSASDAASSAASANAVVQGTAAVRHSVRPSLLLDFANSKTLDPRITFSRSSAGTYYDGKTTVKAEENLLTYSQEFDNAVWSPSNSTITANATTAPDGTTTADRLTASSAASTLIFHSPVSVTDSVAFSVYAKAGTLDAIQITTNGTSVYHVNFDLTSGVVGNNNTWTGSIVNVGNGWYRCTAYITVTPSTTLDIQIVNSGTSSRREALTSTGDLYLWGAQVEVRSSVTAYTPTTSQPITNYIPVLQTAAANTARFDHDPLTGESKGLLIEESRTNLIGSWDYGNAPHYTLYTIAPDGTNSALCPITEAAADRFQHTITGGTYSTGTQFTFSWFVKALEGWGGDTSVTTGGLSIEGANLTASNKRKIQDCGNGWERWAADYTIVDGSVDTLFRQYIGTYNPVYTNRFAYWGAQLEVGSFPTSYIATSGAQVTRSVDSPSISFQDFGYNKKASTALLNGQNNSDVDGYQQYYIGTNTDTYARWSYSNNSEASLSVYSSTDSGLNVSIGDLTDNGDFKIGIAIDGNGASYALNGNYNEATGTTNGIRTIPQKFYIGTNSQAKAINGWVSKFAYYPTRLSNAELTALTED